MTLLTTGVYTVFLSSLLSKNFMLGSYFAAP